MEGEMRGPTGEYDALREAAQKVDSSVLNAPEPSDVAKRMMEAANESIPELPDTAIEELEDDAAAAA